MKNFKRFGAAIVALFIGLFILVGCGDKSISYLEIKSGTFAYEYEQDEEVKWDDLVILAKYNDNTVVEVAYGDEDLTVSDLDTSKTGTKDIKITYKKKSVTVSVRVKAPSETTLLVRAIDALPAVENITLENRAAVEECKTKYDALSAEGKALITNHEKLEAAVAKITAIELANYKVTKKAELAAYKNEANYSAENWAAIQGFITAANTSIDGATSKDAVNTIVATAKTSIDGVPDKDGELRLYKASKQAEVDSYVAAKNEADYSEINWLRIGNFANTAKTNIGNADNKADIDAIIANFKDSVDAIKTIAAELTEYKTAKKAELAAYKQEANYNADKWVTIQARIATANTAIDNAADKAAVDAAVASAKADMDAVLIKEVDDVVTLIAALPDVASVQLSDSTAVAAARTAYNGLSVANRNAVTNYAKLQSLENRLLELGDLEYAKTSTIARLEGELQDIIDHSVYNDTNEAEATTRYNNAIAAVNAATSVQEVIAAGTVDLSDLKIKEVTDVEDAITAIPALSNMTTSTITADAVLIDAARTAYDALSGANKDKVDSAKVSALEAAEAKLAANRLQKHKNDAKAELEGYVVETNYNASKWADIQTIIATYEANIDAVTASNEANIDVYVTNAKTEIDGVKYKAITDVEDAITALPTVENVTTSNKSAVEAARYAYNQLTAGEKSRVESSLVSKLSALETRIAELELAEYKASKKAELAAYANTKGVDNYVPSRWAQIQEYVTLGKGEIDHAENTAAIDTALAERKTDIDGIRPYEDTYTIVEAEAPNNISIRDTRLANNNPTAEAGYYDAQAQYVVGNANVYNYVLNMTATRDNGANFVTLQEYRMVYELLIRSNPAVAIDTNNASTYEIADGSYLDEVKEYSFGFDFSAKAADKYFVLKVGAYNENPLKVVYSYSPEFKVLDGYYNITNAKQLGVITNCELEKPWEAGLDYDHDPLKYYSEYMNLWSSFLTNNGITVPATLKGVILQNDIAITRSDLPEKFFKNNHMRDWLTLYSRSLSDYQTFTVEGNYFTLDTSALPIVNLNTAMDGVSHSALFYIFNGAYQGDEGGANYTPVTTTVRDGTHFDIRNLSLIGNDPAGTDPYAGFGAMITSKSFALTQTVENTLVKKFYINMYLDGGQRNAVHSVLKMHHVKSYDAYQSHFMGFGSNDVYISESEFARCGGPDILGNHKAPAEKPFAYVNMFVDDKTKISARVNGSSNWFQKLGQTDTATMITSMDVVIDTLCSDDRFGFATPTGDMNLIMLNMAAGLGFDGKLNPNVKGAFYRFNSLTDQTTFEAAPTSFYKLEDNKYVPALSTDAWAVGKYYYKTTPLYMEPLKTNPANSNYVYGIGAEVPTDPTDPNYVAMLTASSGFSTPYAAGAPVLVADDGTAFYIGEGMSLNILNVNGYSNDATGLAQRLTDTANPIKTITLYYKGLALLLEYFIPE